MKEGAELTEYVASAIRVDRDSLAKWIDTRADRVSHEHGVQGELAAHALREVASQLRGIGADLPPVNPWVRG